MRTAAMLAVCACLAPVMSASAQSTITLFGQPYSVQRFDYSTGMQIPSVTFPGDFVEFGITEVEGFHYLGNNRFLMSSDALGQVSSGEPKNWVIEAELVESGGVITGLRWVRTVLTRNETSANDLDPAGLTINPTGMGIGANGNIVVGSSRERLYAFNFNTGETQAADSATTCNPLTPTTCSLNVSSVVNDLEDVAFVPAFGTRAAAFYVLKQEFPDRADRFLLDGTYQPLGSFLIGGDAPGMTADATPKGLTYLADSSAFPASIRQPGGTLLVALDNDLPGLQVMSFGGAMIAYESLTDTGTNEGLSLLPMPSDCAEQLQLESIGSDPATGRLFLINQGGGTLCNLMWVLTPITATPCQVDFNNDGFLNQEDLAGFLTAFLDESVPAGPGGFAVPPCAGEPAPYDTLGYQADFNRDCSFNQEDLAGFITEYFSQAENPNGCVPG